ncbi:MAG: exonuclease SbcCD subunit D [Candidatus Binatia bacterium]
MSRFAVLHAAELHLDAPFTGVGRTPPRVAAALRDAPLVAWDALIDCAIGRRVAAVLLAGGLAAGLERGVRAHARLQQGFRRLAAHGIPAFVALGTSDPREIAAQPWPEGVTAFPAAGAAVALRRDGVRLATIHGAASAAERGAEQAARGLRRDKTPGLHIGVLHGVLDGGGDPARVTIDTLRTSQLDCWALGGARTLMVHRRENPCIVSPGTPQARARDELGAKGAALIEFQDDAVAQVTLEPLDCVRAAEVRVTAAADLGALRGQLLHAAAMLRDEHEGRALVLTALVAGGPEVCRALRLPDVRASVLADLRAGEPGEPFTWWAALRAIPPSPVATGGDDLAAEVGRQRALLIGDAQRAAAFLQRRSDALRARWTAALEPRDAELLLDEAAALAVDALVAAEEER